MLKYKYLKRALDIFIAYFSLIFSYIPMLIIALLIYFIDGGPIIFKQLRVGKDGKLFVCYKFKTMRNDAPKNLSTEQFKNSSDYITPLGGILRRMSLDELPQLFNVLCGDMSIVGPRPLIPEETSMHKIRRSNGVYDVRPGITGLAQVCGRDRLSDNRKAECDIIYVKNMHFSSDVRILAGTLAKVFSSDGIIRR